MSFFKKQSVQDLLAIVIMIAVYNLCISIFYDTFQYLNIRKIVWAFILGFFVLVPMYAILWVTLRKMKSEFLFLVVSLIVWIFYPILMSQGHSDTFDAWQGGNQIYDKGELTTYGYFHKLQNPFFFLTLYSAIMFFLYVYKKYESRKEGKIL